MLVSDEAIFHHYYNHRIPTICTDNKGRTLDNGFYINKILQKKSKEYAVLIPLIMQIGEKSNINYGKNTLHVVVRERYCQHTYSFCSDLDEDDFLHWIINNGNVIKDFIDQYNAKAKDIILEAKDKKNRFILPTFKEYSTLMGVDNLLEGNLFGVIHKNLHIPIYFTPQERKCLSLLVTAKSAKQIANIMKLSYRTVEHHFERIRRKLGCRSMKEVVFFYGDYL
jgi:DNA-binding CsgD family transcriptional regulator